MNPLNDSEELGRRFRAARCYAGMAMPQFAEVIGRSVPTIRRWEHGEKGSIGRTVAERRQLAERIQEATDCPPEWLGLAKARGDAELRADLERIAEAVHWLGLAALSQDEAAQLEQLLPSARRSEGPDLGEKNE